MWFSFRNVGAGRCIRSYGVIWARFSAGCAPEGSKVEEGHLMPDHVHMLLSIPPKHAVSQVVGYIKGKSAIHMARVYGERKRNFVGQHFWARGFFVNTVGRDEEAIRAYIRKNDKSKASPRSRDSRHVAGQFQNDGACLTGRELYSRYHCATSAAGRRCRLIRDAGVAQG